MDNLLHLCDFMAFLQKKQTALACYPWENTLKLSLPLRASEVIFDSEVHFVSEVSPDGEAQSCKATRANLTSLVRSTNFTA